MDKTGNRFKGGGSTVRIERVFEPNETLRSWYDELYNIYRESYLSLKPIFSRMSDLQDHYAN